MSVPFWVPLVMGGLLLVSGFFSASETALFSLEPLEIRKRTSGGGLFGDSLRWCLDHARSILVTILLSNLAANILYFSLAGWWAGESGGVVGTLIPLGALVLLVLLAEILPKSVALGMAGPFASWTAPVLRGWALVLTPARLPLSGLVRGLAQRFSSDTAPSRWLTTGELEEMLRREPERFGLGRRSADVVGELVGMTGVQVREVMVPIVDLEPVAETTTVAEALDRMLPRSWRWLLVRASGGAIGYVDAKDLLVAARDSPVKAFARPLAIIPELARVPNLLALFRSQGVDRVLVVDEYGNDAGIVGRDDLTENIVGGLARSEHEPDDIPVRLRPHRGWEVDGLLGVHEFEDLFSVRLPIHRNRTIGGLLVDHLGSLPEHGQRVEVAGLTFEIIGVSRGRVHKVLVCFSGGEPAGGEADA